jgi:hypothetical protein
MQKPKRVKDIIERVIELKALIPQLEKELKELESYRLEGAVSSAEPTNFEYKDAIMELFNKKPNAVYKIDDICKHITDKYDFTPDRNTVTIRVGYLVDTVKKLERLDGRRGYRLSTNQTTDVREAVGG